MTIEVALRRILDILDAKQIPYKEVLSIRKIRAQEYPERYRHFGDRWVAIFSTHVPPDVTAEHQEMPVAISDRTGRLICQHDDSGAVYEADDV